MYSCLKVKPIISKSHTQKSYAHIPQSSWTRTIWNDCEKEAYHISLFSEAVIRHHEQKQLQEERHDFGVWWWEQNPHGSEDMSAGRRRKLADHISFHP